MKEKANKPDKNPYAVVLGRRGGLKRAQNLTAERRSEIARIAGKMRQKKAKGP